MSRYSCADPASMPNGVAHEVFGVDRREDGVPAFDYAVCADRPGPFEIAGGIRVTVRRGLAALAGADLVVLPSGTMDGPPSPAVLAAVRQAVERDADVMALCTAAFTLAAAGTLDGLECATHWRYADTLQARFPQVRVNPDLLYARAGRIVTSAGTAAGIDACLDLVRTELGSRVAGRIARRMVVAPHRDGGQRQFIERPLVPGSAPSLSNLLEWIDEHLADEHTVADLARRANVSPRTLLRRFRTEVGATPYAWLIARRVARAQELLETTSLSVEDVARHVGLGTANVLRHRLNTHVGVSPPRYRRQYRS